MPTDIAPIFTLPIELRLLIYNAVIHLDPNWRVLDGFYTLRHYPRTQNQGRFPALSLPEPRSLRGSWTTTENILTADSKPQIPWLNLMLTCKAIATEMFSYFDSTEYRHNDQNHTYELGLDPVSERMCTATWRRMPCRPSEASILAINYARGSYSLRQSFLAVLNDFMHFGPRMDRDVPLPSHKFLRKVIVFIDENVDEDMQSMPTNGFDQLCRVVQELYAGGRLLDHVGSICIRANKSGEREWEAKDDSAQSAVCHFQWKTGPYCTRSACHDTSENASTAA